MDDSKNPLAQLDSLVSGFFAGWDAWSTLIMTLIVVVLAYSFFFTGDEDIHPYFLARQASESPVRRENESATYRNLDTPHGYPLRRGLDIKAADAPKWTSGRSGDLRDIWLAFANRQAAGAAGGSNRSEIYTVLGRFVKAHSVEDITRQIDLVGKQLTGDLRGETVVACLSSSIELVALVFGMFQRVKDDIRERITRHCQCYIANRHSLVYFGNYSQRILWLQGGTCPQRYLG